jgi:hypothetical protein
MITRTEMLGLRRGEKKSGALFSTEGRGNHPPFLSLPFSSSPTNHGRELIHRQRRAPAGSPLAPPPPPTAGCAAAAMASSHGRMRRCSPSRPDAPPPPWPPPAPPPRGPLPPSSLCKSGGARTFPWRWLLHGATATLVLYGERCSSLFRHVCCSMVYAHARLPWRSSRRPDASNEETRHAVRFVVHIASACPTYSRCLTRMLQGFRADVAKVDLDFSTLRDVDPPTQTFDSQCCNCLFSNVADVATTLTYFLCCKY